MKVDILDYEGFVSYNPTEIEKYLAAKHWREIRRDERTVSIWELIDSTSKYRVWLPLDVTLEDYGIAVGRLIKTVAQAENRSQLQLIEDLDTVGIGDVIRAATWDTMNRESSSIPFDDGAVLLKRARNMTYAAACATLEKKAVFSYRSPSQVASFMDRLRLGQTERGSYLVKVISPIREPLHHAQLSLPTVETPIPFERRVVVNLVRSLDVLKKVAEDTTKRGRFYFESFQELVPEGISANLCEAVALGEDPKRFHPLEVSVSWSYALETANNLFDKTISFNRDMIPYIAEAARTFRERNPQEIILTGFVTTLSRELGSNPGSIRVVGRVEGQVRSIRMTLLGDTYNIAIRAHENELEVACEGNLIKEGPFFTLQNPRNFRILNEMENLRLFE